MDIEELEYYFFDKQFSSIDIRACGTFADIAKAIVKEPFFGLNEGDVVALKSPKEPATSAIMRMNREAEVLETIMKQGVPEIITYHGCLYTPDDNIPVIVEELADCDLSQLRRRKYRGKEFPEALMDSVIERIGKALVAVHKLGYFHRDVKPSNIYLIGELAKLGDLGSAGPNRHGKEGNPNLGKGASSSGAHGTPNYSAPEALDSDEWEKFYNVTTDIYSLACVGLYLIAGKTPFDDLALEHIPPKLKKCKENGEYIDEKIAELVEGKQISPHKVNALRKAISPNPEDRQRSMEEFLSDY